jgi:hypothetical protein
MHAARKEQQEWQHAQMFDLRHWTLTLELSGSINREAIDLSA